MLFKVFPKPFFSEVNSTEGHEGIVQGNMRKTGENEVQQLLVYSLLLEI